MPKTRAQSETPAQATCDNCRAELSGRYCNQCGQDSALGLSTVSDWVREGLDHALGLDFRLVRTLRPLLLRPGRLTELYLDGHRQPYTHPFRLYLLVSAFALAVMSATGVLDINALTASVDPEMLAAIESSLGIDLTDAEVRRRYDARVNLLFPVFNLFTPIGLALALKLLHWRELLHKHAIFGLHVASAQVAYSTAALVILYLPRTLQTLVSLLVAVVLLLYILRAYRVVYPSGWVGALWRFMVLCVAYLFIAQGITLATLLVVLFTV